MEVLGAAMWREELSDEKEQRIASSLKPLGVATIEILICPDRGDRFSAMDSLVRSLLRAGWTVVTSQCSGQLPARCLVLEYDPNTKLAKERAAALLAAIVACGLDARGPVPTTVPPGERQLGASLRLTVGNYGLACSRPRIRHHKKERIYDSAAVK